MDFIKISLWLFLVISSASISECTSFRKYLVPKVEGSNNELDDNCFCFKQSGNYQKVPEILGQDRDNLERLVVYLYKDKITEKVKMYIPHKEKQALVPDLAFEVGDKLIIIEDDRKVLDILNIYSHYKHPHIDGNEVLTTTGKSTADKNQYNDNLSHELPLNIDTDRGSLEKTDIPDDNHYDYDEHSYVQPIDIAGDQLNVVQQLKPYIDINKLPSQEINLDNVNYDTTEDVNRPGKDVHSDINNYLDHYPLDPNMLPLQEVNIPSSSSCSYPTLCPTNIPSEINNIDAQNNQPNVDINKIPSKPGQIEYFNDNDYHKDYSHESNIKSQEESIPGESMYLDNNDYYEHPYNIQQEVNNVPIETKNIDGVNYNQQDKPSVVDNYQVPSDESDVDTTRVTSKEVYIPDAGIHFDDFKQHDKHQQPNFDSNEEIDGQPHSDWYMPKENTIINFGEYNNKHLNTDPSYKPSEENKTSKETSGEYENSYEVPPVPNKSKQDDDSNIKDKEESHEAYDEGNSKEDIKSSEKQTINQNKWQDQYNELNKETKHSNEMYNGDVVKNENNAESHQHNNYETFDRWFIQQMQRFKTYTEHDRAINLQIIERYILKILHDNDMHVSTEGVLTDSFGTALDVHNLYLRPILIGDTMAFGTILNDKATDLVMPANMAYLQAILVTNSNPSMILGIIPIGKTVIPPSAVNAFSTVLKTYLHSTWRQPGSQPSSHEGKSNNIASTGYDGEKKPIVLHLTGKQNPIHTSQKSGQSFISVTKEAPILMQSKYERLRNPVETVKNYGTKSISGSKEFVLSNDLEGAYNELIPREGNDPIKSAEATNKLLTSLKNGNDSVTSIASEEKEEVVDEDDIGGRIVGGHAATSSGTPLSVRGRIKDF